MYPYQLQRSRRSHRIKISVTPKGEVVVVAPPDCPTFFIDSFLRKNQDWIANALAKVKEHTAKQQLHPNEVLIFGKKYLKKVVFSHSLKIGVHIKGREVVINPVTDTTTSTEKALEKFLKATAEKYIVPRTHQLASTMKISFGAITLRQQKTRWGSCSSEGNLNFNWRLIHSPPEVIDYVIVHELAHRREMNHSTRFWEIVRQFDPEYKKHQGWLKRSGMSLG